MKVLKESRALITGASRGLGRSLAEALAEKGVNLVLVARGRNALDQTAEELARHGVSILVIPADLSTSEGVEALVREVSARVGGIDILINNAGTASMLPYHRVEPLELAREIHLNFTAPMLLSRLLLPEMVARGQGHIVNISSIAADVPLPYESVYCATKAGLILAAKSLRIEYAGSGIGFSAVMPGVIKGTGMAERFAEKTGLRYPWFFGGCKVEQVTRAVIRAIERNQSEVAINSPPLRPILPLFRLWPGLWDWFARHSTVLETGRRAAETNLQAGGEYTGFTPSPDPSANPPAQDAQHKLSSERSG